MGGDWEKLVKWLKGSGEAGMEGVQTQLLGDVPVVGKIQHPGQSLE